MDDAKRRNLARGLPAFGMAVPFLMALAAHSAGPKPARILAAPVRPALAFDQYLVDLGPVAPSEEIQAHFDFTNRGEAPVEITALVPSCGCLQPQMKKKNYRPGDSGNFVVRVQTANENPGLKEYTITIKYTDPEPREVDVLFRVVLPDNQVIVRPRALAFYQLGQQGPGIAPQRIEVTDRRGKHLNITRVECSRVFPPTRKNQELGIRDIASIELGESDVDEAGHWHGHLDVAVPNKLPAGRVEAIVRIFTDDPEYKVLRVPLIIEGGSPRKMVDPHFQRAGGTQEHTSSSASTR